MTMKINHPKWNPSSQLFYSKYHTAIKLGYFSANSKPELPSKYENYRMVRRYIPIDNRYEIITTVYTSDQNIINYVLQDIFYSKKILSIQGPINQEHIDQMSSKDWRVIVRDCLWYKKYKYKVNSWSNWRNQPNDEQYDDIIKFCYTQFPESRVVNNFGSGYGYGIYNNSFYTSTLYPGRIRRPRGYNASIPLVYTNNQEQIFLFKIAYSDILHINIETVVTHEELETDK